MHYFFYLYETDLIYNDLNLEDIFQFVTKNVKISFLQIWHFLLFFNMYSNDMYVYVPFMTSWRFLSRGPSLLRSSVLMDSRQSGGSGSVSKSGSHVPVGKVWEAEVETSEVAAMFDDVVTADLLPAMSCIEVAGLSKEELKNEIEN